MTRIDRDHTKTGRTGSERYRWKSVLFCRACEHESPIAGDWEVHTDRSDDSDRLVYSCPCCDATFTTRPRRSASTIVSLH